MSVTPGNEPSLSKGTDVREPLEDHPKSTPVPPKGWHTAEDVHRSRHLIRAPRVVCTPEGRVHLIWAEGGWLWHAWRSNDGWDGMERVFRGKEPSLAVDEDGTLHAAFVHTVDDRGQVFHTRCEPPLWQVPRQVARTPGNARWPTIVAASQEEVHVVWEDDASGIPAIYHARLVEGTWHAAPIPRARGWHPTSAWSPDGRLHVVWEAPMSHGAGNDVHHIEFTEAGWSLPENISDAPRTDSCHPTVTVGPNGVVHVVWEEHHEGRRVLLHRWGQYAWWQPARALTSWGTPGQSRAVVTFNQTLHLVWVDDGRLLYAEFGPQDEPGDTEVQLLDEGVDIASQPALWANAAGDLFLVWVKQEDEEYVLRFCCKTRQG